MEEEDISKLLTESINEVESNDPISKLLDESIKEVGNRNSSNITGYNTGIGESRFDEGYLPNMQNDLTDYRSKKQHWLEKSGKGLGRVVNKIGVELAKLPGFVVGGVGALGTEIATGGEAETMDFFVNNAWIRAIEGYENAVNENILPVYTKQSVRDGNIWDNLTSIDFWSTEGADGVAFMLSMLAPGAAVSKLGAGSKLLSGYGKSKKGLAFLNKIDDASKALGLESGASAIDLTTSTLINTMFEAGSEANSAMKSITQNENESDADFALRRGEAGRNVFVSNLGILLLPNMILNKQLLGVSKQANRYKSAASGIESAAAKRSLRDKVWDIGYDKIGKNFLREGFFEEGMQSTMEEYWTHNNEFKMDEILETYLDVIGSTDGQKAIALGGIFGSTASIVGSYRSKKGNEDRDNAIIESMNGSIDFHEKSLTGFLKKDDDGNLLKDDNGDVIPDYGKLKDQAQSISNVQYLNNQLEIAKQTGDVQAYKLIKDQLETGTLLSFIKAGEDGISVLKEKLNDSKAFEDDINNSNEAFNLNNTKEQSINNIIEKAETLRKDYEFFNTYGKRLTGVKQTSKNKNAYNKFISNLENLYLQTKSQKNLIKSEISTLQSELATVKESFKNSKGETTDNAITKSIEETIGNYETYESEIDEQIKHILSSSKQKEAFKAFEAEQEVIEEVEEKIEEEKKNAPTLEEEAENEEAQTKIEEEHQQEETEAVEVNKLKGDVSKAYSVLDEIFENPDNYNLFKDPDSNMVAGMGTRDHVEIVKKHLPDYDENAGEIEIEKIVNKDGTKKYVVTTFDTSGTGAELNKKIIEIDEVNLKEDEALEPAPSTIINEDLNNSDQEFNSNDNVDNNKTVEKKQVTNETDEKNPTTKTVSKKHVKVAESMDESITSKLFNSFKLNPIDKTGNKVTFEVGNAGSNKFATEAKTLLDNILSNNLGISEEQKEFLIQYLPIRVNFKEDVYTQLFNADGTGKFTLDEREKALRQSVVENLLKGSTFNSTVEFQYPGLIQLDRHDDGKPAENKLTEIEGINSINDIKFTYSDTSGRLLTLLDKPSNFNVNIKHAGYIFMTLPMANGRNFPLKLNIRRVNETESDIILKVTEALLKRGVNIQYKDLISGKLDVLNFTAEELEYVKEEAKALDKKFNSLTVIDILGTLIYDGKSPKNMFKISGKSLTYGDTTVDSFEAFESSKESIKDWLINNKNRNIKKSKLNEAPYKKRIVDSVLSTDVKLGEPVFQGNTSMYINPTLEVTETKVVKKDIDSKQSEIDEINKDRERNLKPYNYSLAEVNKMPQGLLRNFLMQANQAINNMKTNGGQKLLDYLNENRSSVYDKTAEDKRFKKKQNTIIASDAIDKGLAPNWKVNDLRQAIKLYNSLLSNKEAINAVYYDKIKALEVNNEEVSETLKVETDKKVSRLKKKSKKSRGKRLSDLKKGLKNMKKDNNNESNTICD